MTATAADARAACEALCHAYGRHADAGEADTLAALYTPDGVFDRMGQVFAGREAIRDVIAGRAPGVWTRHRCGAVAIHLAPDGLSATGTAALDMDRGRAGSDQVEHLRAEYADEYRLTTEGWRFARRTVRLLP